MSNQHNRPSSTNPLKNFSLKTTAAAILALHAEATMASPPNVCPASVVGTEGAGTPCYIEYPSGPVFTVTNQGIIGSVTLTNFSASQIIVNAGGTINNIALTDAAINITDGGVLSNGISNQGLITGSSSMGINLSNSTVGGGLTNSGIISTDDYAIYIADSTTLTGNILNSGKITSSNTSIRIYNQNTINGSISNTGSIITTADNNEALYLYNSTLNGDITNQGSITGGNNGNGILIHSHGLISGNISNTGSIQAGYSGIAVNNNSSITGSIVNDGVITATTQDALSLAHATYIDGHVTNNGSISAGRDGISLYSDLTLMGGLSNTGSIEGDCNGINIDYSTVLNGALSNEGTIKGNHGVGIRVADDSIVNGDISNTGTIQGQIRAIYIDNSSTLHNINILGSSAKIIGPVDAVNTNVNITENAIFQSAGTYSVERFNIANNATFNMRDSISVDTTVNNSGTIAIDDTTQSIDGNYIQTNTGIFQAGVLDIARHGQLQVTNEVDLSQSGRIHVQVATNSSIHEQDVFTSVISGDILTPPTNGFEVTDSSFIWDFTASSSGNSVDLTASVNPAIQNICQNDYCEGASSVIIEQVIEGNPLFGEYAAQPTASAFTEAVRQATPELTIENIQAIQLVVRAVEDTAPIWDILHGEKSKDSLSNQGQVWGQPYAATMRQHRHSSIDGFYASAYGLVIGKDIQLPEDWLFGGAFAIGRDSMHGASALSGQYINTSTYQGMIYGAKKLPHHAYLAGQGLIGYENNHTRRSIPAYASISRGSYDAWFAHLRAAIGQVYQPSSTLTLTPELEASYLSISQGGYQESGSPMDLKISSSHHSVLGFGASCHGAYHLASLKNQHELALTAYGGIYASMLNSQPQINATFVAGGDHFSTTGIHSKDPIFKGGLGLAISGKSPLLIHLSYDIQAGNDAYSNAIAATFLLSY